ncbi:MAG: alpha/beta hydrolase [Pirellulales bacterium]|nr:alpha/beta hydrolase [Pirellulales bacterium]
MRVFIIFLFLGLPCMAEPLIDEFTKQEIPASGKGIPEVVLAGSQVKNLQYAEVDGKPLLLDLYLPEKPEGSPLVIWVHGGGWKGGSKQNCFVKWLSNFGYTVASINYRLVDVAKWPAQLHDCKGAIRWLRANAQTYGYNPDCVIAAGASAGGHLVALLGTTGDSEELEGNVGGNSEQSSRVQAVVDYYGATDFLLRSRTQSWKVNKPESVVYNLLGGPANQLVDKAKQASAKFHVTPDDAPLLVFHGGKDTTVLMNQTDAIEEAYKKHNLPVTVYRLKDAGHGGFVFYSAENAKHLCEFLEAVRTTK